MQNSRHRREQGQVLILVLIFMLVVGLMIPPVLSFMITGLKSGQMYENRMLDDYAADAGIEHAIHDIEFGMGNLPDDIGESLDYSLDGKVNDRDVEVNIEYLWVLEAIEERPKSVKYKNNDWTLSAKPHPGKVVVEIMFTGKGVGRLERLGIFIPPSFDYVAGSSSEYEDNITLEDPKVLDTGSGKTLVWTWKVGIKFEELDVRTQTFDVIPAEVPLWSISWVKSSIVSYGAHSLSWDDSYELYKVTSTAGDTKIESYILKGPYMGRGKFQTLILTYNK